MMTHKTKAKIIPVRYNPWKSNFHWDLEKYVFDKEEPRGKKQKLKP